MCVDPVQPSEGLGCAHCPRARCGAGDWVRSPGTKHYDLNLNSSDCDHHDPNRQPKFRNMSPNRNSEIMTMYQIDTLSNYAFPTHQCCCRVRKWMLYYIAGHVLIMLKDCVCLNTRRNCTALFLFGSRAKTLGRCRNQAKKVGTDEAMNFANNRSLTPNACFDRFLDLEPVLFLLLQVALA